MLTPKRDIIVIGASAGGVSALCEFIKNLPRALQASIFVVMHIGSKSYLAEILSRCGNLVAVAAENGKPYQHGCICVPLAELAEVFVWLVKGTVDEVIASADGASGTNEQADIAQPASEPPGNQIPLACPECNGPIYEIKDGDLAQFECLVGHR